MANSENMRRSELQTEAMIIQSLLNAAMALQAGGHHDDSAEVLEIAHSKSKNLNNALDIVNPKEFAV